MHRRTLLVAAAFVASAMALAASATIAQELSPQRPADIRLGSCAAPGEVVVPLTSLSVPPGETQGLEGATAVEQSVTQAPMPIADLLATGHVVTVHPLPEDGDAPIACGEIGGTLASDGTLAVGLNAMNGAKASGVAYFAPTPEGDGATVTLLVVDERAGRRGTDGTDAAVGGDGGDGAPGTAGAAGAVGADGEPGTAGADGVGGQNGADGTDGADGADSTSVIEGSPATAGEDGVITISADNADGANAKPERNRDKATADRDANGNAGSATSGSATDDQGNARDGGNGGGRAGKDGSASG